MMNKILIVITIFLLIPLACIKPGWSHTRLIQLGTDRPSNAELKAHWEEFDNTAPFDGITISINFTQDQKKHGPDTTLSTTKWRPESLETPLNDLKNVKFKNLKNNFFKVYSPLKYIEWDDDAGWDNAISNIALLASLAKKSETAHIKGLSFDPETWESKQYKPTQKRPFGEECALARKRGAQMMKAITAQYPDITIWSLWLFSRNRMFGDFEPLLETNSYGLWPSFINGWLDALPPQALLIDGMEDAYYFDDINEFAQYYALFKNPNSPLLTKLLDRNNVNKYKNQVSISFGVYLDSFFNEQSIYYRPNIVKDASMLNRIRRVLSIALNTADDYVWLCNEKVKWFPKNSGDWSPTGKWTQAAKRVFATDSFMANDIYPGINDAINLARESTRLEYNEVGPTFQKLIGNSAKIATQNLLANGNFPNDYSSWDTSVIVKPAGNIVWDSTTSQDGEGGSVLINAPKYSIIRQHVKVEPGQMYHATAWAKHTGKARSMVRIQWKTGDHREWLHTPPHFHLYSSPSPDSKEWKSYSGVVQVPEHVSDLYVVIIALGTGDKEDAVWIDNVQLIQLEPNKGR